MEEENVVDDPTEVGDDDVVLPDDIGFPDVPDETKYKYKKKFSQPVVNMDLGCGDTLNKNHTGELKMLV